MKGGRQVRHAVGIVITSQRLAALGVGTFCPGTVQVTCVWWVFGVTVLTRASALNCALVDEDASGATRNQVTMRAYTEPRDTRGTTAGQPEGPRRDNPRDCSRGTRGTTRGAEMAQVKRTGHRTGHRTGQLKMRPGIELVALRES